MRDDINQLSAPTVSNHLCDGPGVLEVIWPDEKSRPSLRAFLSWRAGYWGPKIERNVARDRENEEGWKRLGWDVLVLWECQAKEREALKQVILAFLPPRREGQPSVQYPQTR